MEFIVPDAVTLLFVPGGIDEELLEFGFREAASKQRADIPFIMTEQAGSNLAFRGHAKTIAGAAEWRGDG